MTENRSERLHVDLNTFQAAQEEGLHLPCHMDPWTWRVKSFHFVCWFHYHLFHLVGFLFIPHGWNSLILHGWIFPHNIPVGWIFLIPHGRIYLALGFLFVFVFVCGTWTCTQALFCSCSYWSLIFNIRKISSIVSSGISSSNTFMYFFI